MSKINSRFSELLHDFKSPLSSSNLALQYIAEGKVGEISHEAKNMLLEVISRQKGLLEKIIKFEKDNE